MKQKNLSIEGLRGWLIFAIVLYHYSYRSQYYLNTTYSFGQGFVMGKQLGVFGFFVISGYLLFASLKRNNIENLKDMLVVIYRKVKRLYIPFFVSILFIVLTYNILPYSIDIDTIDVILNLLLVGTVANILFIDGAHWYLFSMIQLTIIVPLLYYSCKKRNMYLLLTTCIILFLLFYFHVFVCNKLFLLAFIMGCLLSYKSNYSLIVYVILGLLECYLFKMPFLSILIALLPYVLWQNNKMPYLIKWLLENKIIVTIGSYSFMWYLIHQQFGYSLITILKTFVGNDYVIITIAFAVSFIFAILLQITLDRIIKILKI